MAAVTREFIERMTEEIVRTENPEKIYLFGSFARGDAREDSDVDILVVTNRPFDSHHSRRQVLSSIRQALSQFHVAKDILVLSAEEMEKWQHSTNHIASAIAREGIVLHERS